MKVLDTLLALSEYLAVDSIALHSDRCLNTRHKKAGCSMCAEICPADEAITVTNGKPALNTEACLACGLCLHRCPSGAYTRPDPLPGKLVKTVAVLPSGPVDLLCPVHPTPEQGIVAQAVQTKRCLAALAPATLLELAASGREVWLDDTYCPQCPLGKVHATLVQIVAEANAWAITLNNSGTIRPCTRQNESAPKTNRPVFEADKPPMSRRGLFKTLGQLKPQNPDEFETSSAPKPSSNRSVPVSRRLPHAVPRQRAKILAILEQAAAGNEAQSSSSPEPIPAAENALLLAEVSVELSKCSACELCVRFCPTEALTFLSDSERFALSFRPRLCLGESCGICIPACPEDAVTLKPAGVSADILTRKQYLAAGALTPCQKCGQLLIAAGHGQPSTCFVCRLSKTQSRLLASI